MKKILALFFSLLLLLCFVSCGKSSAEQSSCTNHTFGSWTTNVQSTCQTTGTQIRSCSNCGKTETQSIPKSSSHNVLNGKCTICKKVINAYDAFVYYVKQNGDYDYEDSDYSLVLGITATDNGTYYYRQALYDSIDKELSIAILWDDAYYLSITIERNSSIYEYGMIDDSKNYYMFGSFYPSSFSSSTTTLYCSTTNISSTALKTSFRELGAGLAALLLTHLSADIIDSDVTAYDLGFKNF